MRIRSLQCLVASTSWLLFFAGPLYAQTGPTEREQELEKMVRDLIGHVQKLEDRVDQLEAEKGNGARLKALEENVEQIKKDKPPAENSAEWQKIKEWVNDGSTLRARWKDGLRLDSMDESISLKIGGRMQYDWAYFTQNSGLEKRIGSDLVNDSEFRRTRFYISGNVTDRMEFKTQYDFSGGDADFKDVYFGLKKLPYVGNLRIGQFKEPFGLEELTSSNDITFLERSLANTFTPSRNAGFMIHNSSKDKRMTWATGIFRQTDSFGDGLGGRDYNVTARVTGLPIYKDKGRKLLHLGLAYTHQNYEGNRIRFRERPESHLAPRFVDTGMFTAQYGDIIGTEIAYVDGPLSVQGEYVYARMEGSDAFIKDSEFWAASLQASYFLTGEHRPYKTSNGTFGHVKPKQNWGKDGGEGAWELAARYSYLTLNDGWVKGGRLKDLTLGMNWYLNPNLRMMWNYIYADAAKEGYANIFQWRFQFSF